MYTYKVEIVRVVDGDTVRVDIDLGFDMWMKDVSVRLKGIDTPETRTVDPQEKYYGQLAKEALEALLSNRDIFLNVFGTGKDKYGRILGHFLCRPDDVHANSINARLVEEYHAVAYYGQSKTNIKAAHMHNRQRLQESGDVEC
jgi:micrococcal nuclease